MTPTRIKLWDSVTLSAIKTDKFKTGMLSISLAMPLTRKLTANNMLLSGVLRRGSEEFPSAALLNRRLDELYASAVEIKNVRHGKTEVLIFSADMLDNAFVSDGTDILDGVAQLLAQVLQHPLTENGHFPAETVKKEKIHVRDAIKAEMNNPKAYSRHRCTELLHKNDDDFPTLESLEADVISADELSLYEHYKNLLANASVDIFYVGSESIETVAQKIKRHFAEFGASQSRQISPVAESAGELKEVTEPFEVSQGKLVMGFRTGVCATDSEYFATVLFNEIFGGSPASKLFMNVRERLSLCYYCASSYDTYLGNLIVSSGIDVANFDTARTEILAQLDEIKQGKISEAELVAAKKSIAHWYRQMYDFPFELFAFYSTRAMLGIDASPEDYMARFEAVSVDEIVSAAKRVTLEVVYFLKGTLENDGEYEEADE
ncbi:MAG: insulinase family protein [Clostridia bacterium]|nr:insulinase family protein [Clostridia bacterium]